MEFKTVKLSDVVSVLGDGIHGTPKYTENGEYYFINGNNLSEGKIIIKQDTKRVDLEEYKKYKKELNERTLLVSINGTLGNVAVYNNEKCILGKSACYFNIKENVNKEFIKYILYSKEFQKYIQEYATGTTIKNMSLKAMREYEFKLPEINIQNKIACILSNIDKKIELNNQINDNLYEITNKLYEQLFVIERQDDWKEYNLQELMDISNGYSYTGKELVDTSVVGMATIKNFERTGGFKEEGFKDIEPIKAKDIHYADKFDILVACTDLTQNADIIGNAIMLLNIGNYEKVVISMDLVKILPKKNKYLVFSILNSKEFKNFALGYKTGTTVLHLNKNCFKDFRIKLPDFDKIENFEKVVETNYKKISYNLEENNTLTQLRDTLLPKLMNGEIDLDKIEI